MGPRSGLGARGVALRRRQPRARRPGRRTHGARPGSHTLAARPAPLDLDPGPRARRPARRRPAQRHLRRLRPRRRPRPVRLTVAHPRRGLGGGGLLGSPRRRVHVAGEAVDAEGGLAQSPSRVLRRRRARHRARPHRRQRRHLHPGAGGAGGQRPRRSWSAGCGPARPRPQHRGTRPRTAHRSSTLVSASVPPGRGRHPRAPDRGDGLSDHGVVTAGSSGASCRWPSDVTTAAAPPAPYGVDRGAIRGR